MQDKENFIWLTNLRGFAAISVIFLHVSAQIIYQYGKIPDSQWWAGIIYENLNRFAVPAFILMTGFLILGKNESLGGFFKKRFMRILIPFIFWGIIYTIYEFLVYYLKNGTINLKSFTETFVINITNGYGYHTWYVYMLIGLYLAYPVLNKFVLNSNGNEIKYFLIICLASIILSVSQFEINSIDLGMFTKWLGLFVLGYYLKKYQKQGDQNLLYIFFYIISYVVICTITYLKSKEAGQMVEFFKPIDILQGIAVFFLFMKNSFFNKRSAFLELVSKYSYGIYLVHVLIINIIAKLGLGYYSFNPYFSIPIITILTFIFSFSVVYIIDKFIPFGRKIAF